MPTQTFGLTYAGSRTADFWFMGDGVSEIFINNETANMEVLKVLRAKKQTDFNLYRSYHSTLDINSDSHDISTLPKVIKISTGQYMFLWNK